MLRNPGGAEQTYGALKRQTPRAKTYLYLNPPSGTQQKRRQQRPAAAEAYAQRVLPVLLDPGTGRGIWMDNVGDSQYCGDGCHGSPLL